MMIKYPLYCHKEIETDKFVDKVIMPRLYAIDKYL